MDAPAGRIHEAFAPDRAGLPDLILRVQAVCAEACAGKKAGGVAGDPGEYAWRDGTDIDAVFGKAVRYFQNHAVRICLCRYFQYCAGA